MLSRLLPLVVLILAACGGPGLSQSLTAPPPLELPAIATAEAHARPMAEACDGTWLRLPHPHELNYELDEWTVFLVAEHHNPETLVYTHTEDGVLPGPPSVYVGPGPSQQAPVVIVRVGSYGKPLSVTLEARQGRDCSGLTLAYPFDHSGGQ